MPKTILIVLAETKIDLHVFNNDETFIIGVERGCLDLIHKKIKIDLAIADFDHVLDNELVLIKQAARQTEVLEPNKDLLDGEVAILRAKQIDNQANILFIAKATKRYDMNLSAINLVKKYNVKLINDDSCIFKLEKGINKLNFSQLEIYTYISFFAFEQTTLSIGQMKYNVTNFALNVNENSCMSNGLLENQDPIITTNNELICVASK